MPEASLLYRVARKVWVTKDEPGGRVQAGEVPTDEQAESLMVASACSLDETCLVHGAPQVAAAKTADTHTDLPSKPNGSRLTQAANASGASPASGHAVVRAELRLTTSEQFVASASCPCGERDRCPAKRRAPEPRTSPAGGSVPTSCATGRRRHNADRHVQGVHVRVNAPDDGVEPAFPDAASCRA